MFLLTYRKAKESLTITTKELQTLFGSPKLQSDATYKPQVV